MTVRASIIADSISPMGYRLTTFEMYYPRVILAEVNTHRMSARSSQSSRAIPLAKRIADVRRDPWIPKQFQKNQPGMQARDVLAEHEASIAREAWMMAIERALESAERLGNVNLHKQHANRVIETYAHTYTVMTATEWDNFFNLRNHPDAQPEFEDLAALMQQLYDSHIPAELAPGEWHLPYITRSERANYDSARLKIASAARCARVSYKTHDGRTPELGEDFTLARRLLDAKHLSPFDHPAQCDHRNPLEQGWLLGLPQDHRHLVGWRPARVQVELDHGLKCRRFAR